MARLLKPPLRVEILVGTVALNVHCTAGSPPVQCVCESTSVVRARYLRCFQGKPIVLIAMGLFANQ